MTFKKENKHSVTYECHEKNAPLISAYVMKDWLDANNPLKMGESYPTVINIEVKVLP